MPPHAGHKAWWSHQSHRRVLFGRKSPAATARSIAAQIAVEGALEADQLTLVRGVGQSVAVLEVEQFQLRRDDAAGAPQDSA